MRKQLMIDGVPYVIDVCKCCGQETKLKATCCHCIYYEYFTGPDAWYCAKGKSASRLCKEFKWKK
jgi:hypothetical protein